MGESEASIEYIETEITVVDSDTGDDDDSNGSDSNGDDDNGDNGDETKYQG
jgi:hypothetical protein